MGLLIGRYRPITDISSASTDTYRFIGQSLIKLIHIHTYTMNNIMLSINERNCHVNIMYVQTGTKYHTLHSGRKAVSFTNHNNKHLGLVQQN